MDKVQGKKDTSIFTKNPRLNQVRSRGILPCHLLLYNSGLEVIDWGGNKIGLLLAVIIDLSQI